MYLVKCQKCKEYFPRELFYKNKSKENGLSDFCKECQKLAVRKKTLSLPCIDGCGKNQSNNATDGRCADCRYKLKMRLKYRDNPEYYRKKNKAFRTRHADIDAEVKQEELEVINSRVQLTKGERLALNWFNEGWISSKILDRLGAFSGNDLERLEQLGFIIMREVDGSNEYALTEKGLEFLNNSL